MGEAMRRLWTLLFFASTLVTPLHAQVSPPYAEFVARSAIGGPIQINWQDSLVALGPIHPAAFGLAGFGDTDHDGLHEVFMVVNAVDSTTLVAVEWQGHYQDVFSARDYIYPYAVADLDQDGKSELVGQIGFEIRTHESPNGSTHPTIPSWSSPPLSNFLGYSIVGDTDQDGKLEIIHSINPSRLIIYENVDDNQFVQRFIHQGPLQHQGNKVIHDFDGDTIPDIAVSGSNGHVQIFESQGDDAWVRIYHDSTGLKNAYGIGGGYDTDGNGLPELFIVGDDWPEKGPILRSIYIYEAPGNNKFVRVATLTYDDQHVGGLVDAVAVENVDGVGLPEAVFKFYRVLLIGRAVSPGHWVLTVGAVDPDPNGRHSHLHLHDVNQNGRPELFWIATTNTMFQSLVLEHPGTSPSDSRLNPAGFASVTVTPNPVHREAIMTFGAGVSMASTVVVFDVAGRLVQRHVLPQPSMRQFAWSALPRAHGLYFVQVLDRAGRPLATGRATVVH